MFVVVFNTLGVIVVVLHRKIMVSFGGNPGFLGEGKESATHCFYYVKIPEKLGIVYSFVCMHSWQMAIFRDHMTPSFIMSTACLYSMHQSLPAKNPGFEANTL